MSEEERKEQYKETKTSKLAGTSAFLALGSVIALFLLTFCIEQVKSSESQKYIVVIISLLSLFIFAATVILAYVFGIVSIFRIHRSKGRLNGIGFAIAGTHISFLMGFLFITAIPRIRSIAPRMVCGSSMSALGRAMLIYADDYNGMLPTPSKWCDLLIEHGNVTKEQFKCRGSKRGPCNYAMNKNIEKLGMNGSPDMVLLFETDPGWNQFGGAEILTTAYHEWEGCNVLFLDNHVFFERTQDLQKLKWKPDEAQKE
ncbi:MAG: TIGR04086 family membrane protein [Planctomycetota bacterium]|jgi:prepilin-type processing-associated H-X9-DG protein